MFAKRTLGALLLMGLAFGCADEPPTPKEIGVTCTSTTECGHLGLLCEVGGPTDAESCAKQTVGRCSPRELCGVRCVFGPIDYFWPHIPDDSKGHYLEMGCGLDSGVFPDASS